VVWRGGIVGAMVASALSIAITAAAALVVVARGGTQLKPLWDAGYFRAAIGLGARLQVASLLVNVAGRFDQLLVYSLSGAAAAGQYSVALTYGTLAFLPPFALAYATFPRLSAATPEDAAALIAKGSRVAVAMTFAVAIPMTALAPLAIRIAFGKAFAPAAAPAMILTGASIVLAAQFFLARGRAARGELRLLIESFGITAAVMIALDWLLIPRFGLMGAAVASLAGNMAGLLRCLAARGWMQPRLALLVPRRGELAEAARSLRALVSRGGASRAA